MSALQTLERLEGLAKAATPGPWFTGDWQQDFGPNKTTVEYRLPEVLRLGQSSIWPGGIAHRRVAETDAGERPLEDAAYIAAHSPDVALKLIAVARAAQEWMNAQGTEQMKDRLQALCDAVGQLESEPPEGLHSEPLGPNGKDVS